MISVLFWVKCLPLLCNFVCKSAVNVGKLQLYLDPYPGLGIVHVISILCATAKVQNMEIREGIYRSGISSPVRWLDMQMRANCSTSSWLASFIIRAIFVSRGTCFFRCASVGWKLITIVSRMRGSFCIVNTTSGGVTWSKGERSFVAVCKVRQMLLWQEMWSYSISFLHFAPIMVPLSLLYANGNQMILILHHLHDFCSIWLIWACHLFLSCPVLHAVQDSSRINDMLR